MDLFAISILFNDSEMTKEFLSQTQPPGDLHRNLFSQEELYSVLKSQEMTRVGKFKDSIQEIMQFLTAKNCTSAPNKLDLTRLESKCAVETFEGRFFRNVWKSLLQNLVFESLALRSYLNAPESFTESNCPRLTAIYGPFDNMLKMQSQPQSATPSPAQGLRVLFDQTTSTVLLRLLFKSRRKWSRTKLAISSQHNRLSVRENDVEIVSLDLAHQIQNGDQHFSLTKDDRELKVNLEKGNSSQLWTFLCAQEKVSSLLPGSDAKTRRTRFRTPNCVVWLESAIADSRFQFSSKPPSYPTSHKVKKNWDQILEEEEKKISQNDDYAEDSTMRFFKEIYKNADEDSRRAMMKSFATSNGTVLSTNWKDVKDKDYEGKDKVPPPEGQEFKKFDV